MSEFLEYEFFSGFGSGLTEPIAHRGGNAAGDKKENSIAAFDAAYGLGYRYAETDVLVTKDGKVIAVHGNEPNKPYIPSRELLQSLTYSEIVQDHKIDGEEIPRLEQLFLDFPDLNLFIDPKTNEACLPLAEVIKKHKKIGQVAIGAFSDTRTLAVANKLGGRENVATCPSNMGSVALAAAATGSRHAFLYLQSLGISHYCLPGKFRDLAFTRFFIPEKYRDNYLINERMVRIAHDLGHRIITWTPNLPQDISHALKVGVDGIVSDELELLQELTGF